MANIEYHSKSLEIICSIIWNSVLYGMNACKNSPNWFLPSLSTIDMSKRRMKKAISTLKNGTCSLDSSSSSWVYSWFSFSSSSSYSFILSFFIYSLITFSSLFSFFIFFYPPMFSFFISSIFSLLISYFISFSSFFYSSFSSSYIRTFLLYAAMIVYFWAG